MFGFKKVLRTYRSKKKRPSRNTLSIIMHYLSLSLSVYISRVLHNLKRILNVQLHGKN